MIIFYNKQTGLIKGSILGRDHPQEHFKMQMGSLDETSRIVVKWIPTKWYDEKGNEVTQDKAFTSDYEPDHPQKDIFIQLDQNTQDIHKYKINLQTKLLELLK